LFWALSAKKSVNNDKTVPVLITLVVYLGSIVFGVYLLASTMYI